MLTDTIENETDGLAPILPELINQFLLMKNYIPNMRVYNVLTVAFLHELYTLYTHTYKKNPVVLTKNCADI